MSQEELCRPPPPTPLGSRRHLRRRRHLRQRAGAALLGLLQELPLFPEKIIAVPPQLLLLLNSLLPYMSGVMHVIQVSYMSCMSYG